MASLSTYAKLTKPGMFNPADGGNVVFKFECSDDMIGHNADLIVFGDYNANGTTGTRVLATNYLNTTAAGVVIADFTVLSTDIATPPTPEQQVMAASGKMKAVVVIYDDSYDRETGEGVIFESNEIYVDLLLMFVSDFKFETPDGEHPKANGSAYTARAHYISRNSFGTAGSTEIASYRFYLYDSRRQLIDDSGELYDWNTTLYVVNVGYTFRDLKDGSTYYLRAKATLNGGYTIYLDYTPLTVEYADVPAASNRLTLKSVPGGVKATFNVSGLDYTRVTFSRAEMYVNDYLTFRDVYKDADDPTIETVTFTDGYAVPKRTYIYQATAYNGETVIGTYYNVIEHVSDCIVIADAIAVFYAAGDIKKTPINRNDRGTAAEAMDSIYPSHVINGAPNYESGQAGGIFTLIENCEPEGDNVLYNRLLRRWLNNGRAKVLTHYTGEAWIVTTSGISSEETEQDDLYLTTFNWTQIGDIENIDDYIRLGLTYPDR